MSRNVDDNEEEEEIAQNTLTSIAHFIHTWKQDNFIESVKIEDSTEVDPTSTNIYEWILDIKVVGSERK